MIRNLLFILSLCFLFSCQDSAEKKDCDSSKDTSCLKGNLEDDVIMHVEQDGLSTQTATGGGLTYYNCKKGYIRINQFCVMREEAKDSKTNQKILADSIEEASQYCQSVNAKLITLEEWMAISKKIESNSHNYEPSKPNIFLISQSLFVSRTETIMDFTTGNYEWVSWNISSPYFPSSCKDIEPIASKSSCEGVLLGSVYFARKVGKGADENGNIPEGKIHDLREDKSEKSALVRGGSIFGSETSLYDAYIGNTPAKAPKGVRCTY